jgi:hypothetical protein
MITTDDVRKVALTLPRAYEVLVRDRVKFRVGSIVFLALSRDETELGFGYQKEEREALVAAEPDKFFMPGPADMRYNWVQGWMAAIEPEELWELIVNAWQGTVPRFVREEFFEAQGRRPAIELPPPAPRARPRQSRAARS